MKYAAPKASVVIPVFNCRGTIAKCINSLTVLEHPSFEVIIVDDGSTDGTAEICEAFPRIRVIKLDRGGPSRARNVGISQARGELIAFTDGDCIVDRRWLTELEKGFDRPEVAGVGGDQKSPQDETKMGRRIQEFLKLIGFMTDYIKTASVMRETEHNPSCNVMYRKSVVEEVGGFDEELFPSEDVELDLKIRRRGYALLYNPAAFVGHYRPGNYRDFASMMRRYGASQRYLVSRYGFFRRLHFVPAILTFWLALIIGGLISNPPVGVAIMALSCAAPVWFYIKKRNIGKSLQFTLFLAITVINWNFGFLRGYRSPIGYKPRQPSRPA
jgi:glycosyltransferase involved in cell wall biosynthesis